VPSYNDFLGYASQNGILIGSAVFAGLLVMTNTQTYRHRQTGRQTDVSITVASFQQCSHAGNAG